MAQEVWLGDILGPLSFEAQVMMLSDTQMSDLISVIDQTPGVSRSECTQRGKRDNDKDYLRIYIEVGYESGSVRRIMETTKMVIDRYQRVGRHQEKG